MRYLARALCIISMLVFYASICVPELPLRPIAAMMVGLAIAIPELAQMRDECKLDTRWLLFAILVVLML